MSTLLHEAATVLVAGRAVVVTAPARELARAIAACTDAHAVYSRVPTYYGPGMEVTVTGCLALLAADVIAESLSRDGLVVVVAGWPRTVLHQTCGHRQGGTAWRLGHTAPADLGDHAVPTRYCPGCRSHVSGAAMREVEALAEVRL